jgi:protein-S-isoprenylcysteine O-methyltransferase Ste14
VVRADGAAARPQSMMGPVRIIQLVWLGVLVVGGAFFVDTPLRTFYQPFTQNQWRARLALLTVELYLLGTWAVLRYLARWDFPLAAPDAGAWPALAGLVISIAGVGLAIWARIRLGQWFSGTFGIKPGHELVTDGPYGITRHPIYTGLLATLAGGALVWNSGLTLCLAGMMTIPFFLHTVFEEAMFEKHFGKAYFDYERRVPRLVPFPRRIFSRDT